MQQTEIQPEIEVRAAEICLYYVNIIIYATLKCNLSDGVIFFM